ncbi:MAG: substrate-binding domain-containing protein, partial [Phycicoccus sp.]
AAVQLGLEPGREIGVVGFDGSETAAMHHLSSVAQPFDAVAEEALTLVGQALRGEPAPREGSLLLPGVIPARSTRREPP